MPVDDDLLPAAFELGGAEAEAWATVRLGDSHPCYRHGREQWIHPSWLPIQYVNLVRHNCRQPDVGTHVSGRVQHLRLLRPPFQAVLAGRWIMHEQRKERWWSGEHGMVLDRDGGEVAYFGKRRSFSLHSTSDQPARRGRQVMARETCASNVRSVTSNLWRAEET